MPTKTRAKNEYLTTLEQVEQLSKRVMTELKEVTGKFPFRSTRYYLSLIDWKDPRSRMS